jgi:tRNA threonylcarbamoyladenosine biosynthesis protein TsaB
VKLLALDTATELCSAALWLDGALTWREEMRARAHGQLILPMVKALLADADIELPQLDAIAFGRGPGAFTGVRLGLSVAQGLAFSAGLPLMPISDLRAVAAQALLRKDASDRVLVCQDARMGEVYWGCFERSERIADAVGVESVAVPAEVRLPADWLRTPVCAAGSGFAAFGQGLSAMVTQLGAIADTLLPRAQEVARLAAADGLSRAIPAREAQPVYLRDQVAKVPIASFPS